jgi:hypothetical protein
LMNFGCTDSPVFGLATAWHRKTCVAFFLAASARRGCRDDAKGRTCSFHLYSQSDRSLHAVWHSEWNVKPRICHHLTYALAVTRTTVSGLVSAPFPVYSFALALHPLSALPLDSQYTTAFALRCSLGFSPSHKLLPGPDT